MKPILVSFKHKRDVSRGKQYHPISSRILQWEIEIDLLRLKKKKQQLFNAASFPSKKNHTKKLLYDINMAN